MAPAESKQSIQEHVDRVVASAAFQQVDRLKRFLAFVVRETLAGKADQLKEFVIGVEVFDKSSTFDPRTDPIVRVQARRLRARLAMYYEEEGSRDAWIVELPKGGYIPVFRPASSFPRPASVRRPGSIAVALAGRNTVSVLPFADHSPHHTLAYFCDGLSQEITHRLANSRALRVIASPAPADVRVDAAMLVRGGVRLAGDIARIIVELIDAASGTYLWSESFDLPLAEPLRTQAEVASAVAAKLTAACGAGESGPGRENLAARNLCLQGRYHMNQRTEEGLRKAIEFFEKAKEEDGQSAEAYSGLADSWGLLGHYGVLPPSEVWTKAASAAANAVLLDHDSANAHTSLAHVKATQDWDWAAAEAGYSRALQLDARHATAHHWYGISCLAPAARLDEALEQLRVAHALDPVSSIIARDLAMVHYLRREDEAALEQIDWTIELNPHFSPAYWTLGVIQEELGNLDEALAAFERATQLSPSSPRMRAGLARGLALSGKKRGARQILEKLLSLAGTRYISPFELASVYFALQEIETGFDWLSKALQDRCFELILLQVDRRFDPLRAYPQFAVIAGRLQFPREPIPTG